MLAYDVYSSHLVIMMKENKKGSAQNMSGQNMERQHMESQNIFGQNMERHYMKITFMESQYVSDFLWKNILYY
jgi:hypothetical protein